mmetsp:Transcript_46701/g.113722  ORF Transcript_46701/g.113722 Transcript_46701/m.113722 type:complete len:298 (+) Transcript_46701:180-1073(+)
MQIVWKAQASYSVPMQPLDPVARGRDHSFDLMVFPLSDGDADLLLRHLLRSNSLGHLLRGILQPDATEELVDHAVLDGMLALCDVHFALLLLGRSQHVGESPVVGQKQEACCVHIQPSHALNAPILNLPWHEIKDRRVMPTILSSALIPNWLVQHQVCLLPVLKLLIPNLEREPIVDVDLGAWVRHLLAINENKAFLDELAAILARSKALLLQHLVQRERLFLSQGFPGRTRCSHANHRGSERLARRCANESSGAHAPARRAGQTRCHKAKSPPQGSQREAGFCAMRQHHRSLPIAP